ncbi:protein phosphatase [Achlya hypogyna]|uniref:Protein phosphatase n=1 Tax=Achlya hypogyna TaxID=1202772 RepID=A0A1V9YPF8_ACHHY|nr:protein phosphatase [Achlya hypogyna]
MLARSSRSILQSRLRKAPGRAFSTRASKPASASSSRREFSAFLFEAHAACKGKRCLQMDAVARPDNCGEDSFFLTQAYIGVADGVGGWNENGVDPSQISRALMRYALGLAEESPSISTSEILEQAYAMTLKDDRVEAGSTTACILNIKEDPKTGAPILEYSNLGDSGFCIVRNGAVWFRSAFQAIGLAPYQLAKIPPRFRVMGAMENMPDEANTGEIELMDGDVIVLATDGVWDNFARDLQEVPAFFPPVPSWRRYWHGRIQALLDVVSLTDVKAAATSIVQASLDHNLKPDDVTVIVARVSIKPTARL